MLLFAVGASFQVTRFLRQHDSILEVQHLENFKSLVRMQMCIALVIGILAVPLVLLSSYIGMRYGLLGTAGVVASSAIIPLRQVHEVVRGEGPSASLFK